MLCLLAIFDTELGSGIFLMKTLRYFRGILASAMEHSDEILPPVSVPTRLGLR